MRLVQKLLCKLFGHKKMGLFTLDGRQINVCYYCGAVGRNL